MAKQHSSLTGVDLHDPKGIGSENTTKILHLTQSVNQVNLSGSILPEVTDKFTLGSSSLVFKSGNFNHISASAGVTGSSISTASFGRFEGDGRGLTNIVASSIPFANITSKPENLVSGSSQIDKNVVLDESNVVSASVIASSAQGQVTLTNNGVAGTAVDLGLQVGDSPTFGGLTSTAGVNINGDSSITGSLTITGKLTAETYVVSSSVTSMSVQQASGSTIFGDSADDIHQFTGSLKILGKIKDSDVVSGSAQLAVNISGSLGTNATLIRSLTASNISGSFTSVSASFSTTTTDTTASISSLKTASGSLSTRVTTLETTTGRTDATISGSFRGELSSSVYLQQVKQSISGSFTSVSSSFSTTTTDTTASIAGLISDSGSVSTRVTTLEANPVFSSTSISGSFGNQRVGTTDNVVFNHITGSGNISGSVTSTGSLGSLIVDGASIDFSNLPTSDPGIAGRVFRQGTDLKISTGGV